MYCEAAFSVWDALARMSQFIAASIFVDLRFTPIQQNEQIDIVAVIGVVDDSIDQVVGGYIRNRCWSNRRRAQFAHTDVRAEQSIGYAADCRECAPVADKLHDLHSVYKTMPFGSPF
jgi:hypothetical protein